MRFELSRSTSNVQRCPQSPVPLGISLSGVRVPTPVYAALYRLGYQPDQSIPKRVLKRYLPKDAVILEAGAHRGEDTLQFSYLWPKGHIHAFEPIPEPRAILERNVTKRRNVTVYPCALGATNGASSMWVSDGADASSSLLRPTGHLAAWPSVGFATQITVPVTTIGKWAQTHGIQRIDGMWLDMQGLELAALQHAGSVFSTTRAIVLEVSYTELYAGQPLWPEVRDWFEGHGFRIVSENPNHSTFGDVLAVRA